MSSNKRKTGGAWRRCKTMTAMHAKQGKARSRAKTGQGPRVDKEAALAGEEKENG